MAGNSREQVDMDGFADRMKPLTENLQGLADPQPGKPLSPLAERECAPIPTVLGDAARLETIHTTNAAFKGDTLDTGRIDAAQKSMKDAAMQKCRVTKPSGP